MHRHMIMIVLNLAVLAPFAQDRHSDNAIRRQRNTGDQTDMRRLASKFIQNEVASDAFLLRDFIISVLPKNFINVPDVDVTAPAAEYEPNTIVQ